MLKVDPSIRPNVEDVHAELVALAFDRNLDLKSAFVVSLILPITHKMEKISLKFEFFFLIFLY